MAPNRRPHRLPPSWAENAGALFDEGAEVRAYCPRCQGAETIDLLEYDREFSFAGKRDPCGVDGCDGEVFYRASRKGAGVWPLHLSNMPKQVYRE